MLFYAALIVAGVIAAAVVVWIARSMMVAGQSAYRTMAPKGRGADQVRLAHLNSNVAAAPAPWGWGAKNGAPAGTKIKGPRFQRETLSPSKSKDWSELELYQRSYAKSAMDRDKKSSTSGSVRNLLTGYDMERPTATDTSSWPYRNDFKPELARQAEERNTQTEAQADAGERPTKPWGW